MLGKTMKRDNVIIKKKEENLPQKLQIYIKWTTKFKTLTVSKKNTCPTQGIRCTHIMWWVQLGNLILTQWYRAPWWLASLSDKSKRPSIRAHLFETRTHIGHMARSARKNNPKHVLYINTKQIGDPWDLQKQSTFQCILITTQWSRFKKVNAWTNAAWLK